MSRDDFLDLPDSLRIPQAERRAAWEGRRPRPTKDMTFKDTAARPDDPGTARLLDERRAKARADEKAAKRLRKEERLIRERRKPKPEGEQPATEQENDDMKKAVAKKAPAARVRKAAKKVVKARADAKKAARSRARKPVKAAEPGAGKTIVQQVADLMARPNGATTAEMVAATKIEAHPLRAKIYDVRHKLHYEVESPTKANGMRYKATPPKGEG